jgi:hypothetical protein
MAFALSISSLLIHTITDIGSDYDRPDDDRFNSACRSNAGGKRSRVSTLSPGSPGGVREKPTPWVIPLKKAILWAIPQEKSTVWVIAQKRALLRDSSEKPPAVDGCSENSGREIVLRNRVSRPCSTQFDVRHETN